MNTLTPEEAATMRASARQVVAQVERVIVGKRETIELLLIALLARGHALIEDIPGVGKTTLARAMAIAVGGTFKRLQFTPDLLPGDVTGLTVFNQKTSEFTFNPGPVFTNILLADEINRATPKTQSALLEAMAEAQVTTEGVTHTLHQPFFVIATQNPIEYRGTYPLPEAQMDRFLMRVSLGYPTRNEEEEMLERHGEASTTRDGQTQGSATGALLTRACEALTVAETRVLQQAVERVYVAPAARSYIVAITHATRTDPDVVLGCSPRGSLALQGAAQAAALLAGREYVTPDDVKRLAPAVLPHRLIVHESASSRLGGNAAEALVRRVLEETPVSVKF